MARTKDAIRLMDKIGQKVCSSNPLDRNMSKDKIVKNVYKHKSGMMTGNTTNRFGTKVHTVFDVKLQAWIYTQVV